MSNTGTTVSVNIQSNSVVDAGTYVVTLSTSTKVSTFSYSDTYTLNVIIVNCWNVIWNANSIGTITTSVLLSPVSTTVFTASSITAT